MRLGVLDIGSNTVNLLIADIHAGGRPHASVGEKRVLRLMRYIRPDGSISEEGVTALLEAVASARALAAEQRVDDLIATATSAVRDATNGPDVVALLEKTLGFRLDVMSGLNESRLTFLAARRWLGWSAGQIMLFDIGGGSLELAAGSEELPDVAASVPLGAGRMTIEFLPDDPPGYEDVERLREHAREVLAPVVTQFGHLPRPDRIVGSSKTIRSLARLAGHPSKGWSDGPRMRLPREELGDWIPRLAQLPASSRHILPGITADRTFQIVAGAVVLHEAMLAFRARELEACPWALREGVLLRYIETMGDPTSPLSLPA